PPIPGLSATECLTSDTFWDLSQLPQRLVVLGGGPSGCELAQAMARFGASVTIVEMSDRILIREDPDAAATVASALAADGVTLLTGHKAIRIDKDRSEEHTSELQSPCNLVCRLLLEKKKD